MSTEFIEDFLVQEEAELRKVNRNVKAQRLLTPVTSQSEVYSQCLPMRMSGAQITVDCKEYFGSSQHVTLLR
jgi:hypothetical protein